MGYFCLLPFYFFLLFFLPSAFFSSSFALMQKKQKIKDNPIRPGVCPACARQKPI
jgi:hypothetical protein